jgi:hypothetical protein
MTRFASKAVRPFDPGDFPRKGVAGFQPHMDMVWHQHPPDSGHFRFSEPPWSGRGRIQQSVPRNKGRTLGSPEIGHSSDR